MEWSPSDYYVSLSVVGRSLGRELEEFKHASSEVWNGKPKAYSASHRRTFGGRI